MGRGVSYTKNSEIVLYDCMELEDMENEDFYDYYIENLREKLKSDFKSLENCKKWLGNEDMAILENNLVYIGVSEYMGFISIWIKSKYEEYDYAEERSLYNLSINWIYKIENKFRKLGKLKKIGTFSNGNSVYERIRRTI